ncbi:MAG: hypothetical protein E7257_11045 [Lachnospiraceae bacterium]|nr:hypothetical protein [Lachnospiraceae bacterium]
MKRKEFTKEIAIKCQNNETALFLGAGMSSNAGLPSWKKLFEPLARELGIDINNTNYQLYDIAQFYANDKGISRLHKKVSAEINRIDETSETLNELTNMQCNSIWTTNFDKVIENNYYKKGKRTNIIHSEENLVSVELNKNINIFKMNGDIDNLKHAIITKKDLEEYNEKHRLLLTFFKRELVVKSFLFIGYSFTDSLVLPCISELSQVFDGEHPYHYAIMQKNDDPDFISFITDLETRYHIKTLLLDDYSELLDVLREINYYTNQYNVFISGSYRGDDEKELREISKFCNLITTSLYKENLRIVNGYGYKVGYYIASAATRIMLEENVTSFEKYLLMYPFDEHLTQEQKYKHREFMIAKANVVIFMYGSSSFDSGMIEEFKIAKKDPRKIIIPIGSTGGAAKVIYDEVKSNIIQYPYLEKVMDMLLEETDIDKLISVILDVIRHNLD